jgi:hypothetical protein
MIAWVHWSFGPGPRLRAINRRLIAPHVPPVAPMACEEFQVGTAVQPLDARVLFIGLAGVPPRGRHDDLRHVASPDSGLTRFASKHTSALALVCHPMPILGSPAFVVLIHMKPKVV